MASRRIWNRASLLLLIAAASSACIDFTWADEQDPRLLDRVCNVQPCELEGSAVRTTGLTQDAVGFRLGPGAGKVRLPVEARGTSFTAEFLVAGHGHVLVHVSNAIEGPQRHALHDEYAWVSISGTASDESDGGGEQIELTVAVEDDGSEAELADIRASGIGTVGGCSVARVGHPRASLLRWFGRLW